MVNEEFQFRRPGLFKGFTPPRLKIGNRSTPAGGMQSPRMLVLIRMSLYT